MIARVLEPEVMDDPSESESYDQMDLDQVNQAFVEDFLKAGKPGNQVIDLGTGTARIPIALCERTDDDCLVMASDAAVSMLEIAKINVAVSGFEHRIQLHHGDCKSLGFEDECCDAVISNSLLHHVAEPRCVVEHMVRIVRPGGRIFVRDLMRPSSAEEVDQLVSLHAKNDTAENQQLLRQSLFAALTLDEMRSLVQAVDYDPESVQVTSDRHWTWNAVRPS